MFVASTYTTPKGLGDVPGGRQEKGRLFAAGVGLLWAPCLRNTQGWQLYGELDTRAKRKCSGSVAGHQPVNQEVTFHARLGLRDGPSGGGMQEAADP